MKTGFSFLGELSPSNCGAETMM